MLKGKAVFAAVAAMMAASAASAESSAEAEKAASRLNSMRWPDGFAVRGKRYRASVRQHQRHAAKARDRRAAK